MVGRSVSRRGVGGESDGGGRMADGRKFLFHFRTAIFVLGINMAIIWVTQFKCEVGCFYRLIVYFGPFILQL